MKIEGTLAEGRFIKRLNRFEAIVEVEGAQQLAHVPNTGRLKELLVEGAAVVVRKYDSPSRKTKLGLLLVKKGEIWVSIDSANLPNKVFFEALTEGRFEQFAGYSEIRREVKVQDSRFDFGLFKNGYEYYIEVKGVTLVEERQAYFPDAPTVRGTRHINGLIDLKLAGKGAGIIFVVQREDADIVRPNDRTDREFGNTLRKAQKVGVDLLAYVCEIDINNKQISIVRQIPVVTET